MNLFAHAREDALANHEQTLTSLYLLRDHVGALAIPPARVSRLRRLLAVRVSAMSAPQESERIVDLLIEEEEDVESFRTELARSGPVYTSELDELWLSMATATHDHGRQEDLPGTAYTALDRAAQLLAVTPSWRRGA